jgi:SSS family solute:Na+ symporter
MPLCTTGEQNMTEQKLNAAQVASMLVSTSCGIGFLLGTGELALHQDMAGSLYAISTTLGLIVLAVYAPLLWTARQSIWTWFNQLYGPSVSRSVALLSLVWMTGVLAAQIRGGAAMLTLTGLPPTSALLLIDGLIIVLSVMRLSWLSVGFAICMLACNATLVGSLIETGGINVWLHAPVRFVDALRQLIPSHTGFTLISVAVTVVCGADYQQFLIAARTPAAARTGCMLAAGIVFAIGFLPASTVIATSSAWHLDHVVDPVQVIPVVLIRTLSSFTMSKARSLVIAMLVTTALGAGCAILRAMSDATATFGPRTVTRPIWSRVLPVLFGSLVASRGQSLVGMMVDLNVVYVTAVGPLLGLTLLNVHVSDRTANAAIAAGCGIAMACYVIRWTRIAAIPEATALFFALPVALVVALASRPRTNASSGGSDQLPASHRSDSPPNTQS